MPPRSGCSAWCAARARTTASAASSAASSDTSQAPTRTAPRVRQGSGIESQLLREDVPAPLEQDTGKVRGRGGVQRAEPGARVRARPREWMGIDHAPTGHRLAPSRLTQHEPVVVVEHQRAAHRDAREGAVAPRVQRLRLAQEAHTCVALGRTRVQLEGAPGRDRMGRGRGRVPRRRRTPSWVATGRGAPARRPGRAPPSPSPQGSPRRGTRDARRRSCAGASAGRGCGRGARRGGPPPPVPAPGRPPSACRSPRCRCRGS